MIAEPTDVRLYDATDLTWIAIVVDHVMDSVGQPWRVLRERLDHSTLRPARVTSILGALRRVLGGQAARARIARRVRAVVLGHPAVDADARQERLAAAAATLGLPAEDLDDLLWQDLAEERPVVLPDGRPDERDLAAYANLDRLQRAVRRAEQLRLRVWGDAHDLIRTARRCGLLVSVGRERRGETDAPRQGGSPPPPRRPLPGLARDLATVLTIVGPLALFHATAVYGRALAALVPLLAAVDRFELVIRCDFGYGPTTLRVAPPVLLPPVATGRRTPSLAARLARDLRRAAAGTELDVALDPPPIVHGDVVLVPDLAVERPGRRWWIELVGFATAEFVTTRLAAYRAAGIADVLLCIDDRRAAADVVAGATLRYQRTVDPAAVLAWIGPAR